MFDFSISKRSKGVITPVKALFRVVEALERLRCFEGGAHFDQAIKAVMRGWLGVTPCSLWLEDGAEEICIIFSLKDESSQWEEYRMYVNREGELSSPGMPEEALSKFQQGLAELFK